MPTSATSRACPGPPASIIYSRPAVRRTPCLRPDIQRYFRDINVLHQHPATQPNSGDEIYDRVLAGVDPNSEIV